MKYLVLIPLVLAGCDSELDFSETVPPAQTSADQTGDRTPPSETVDTAKNNQEVDRQTVQTEEASDLAPTTPTTGSIAVSKLTRIGTISPRYSMGMVGDANSGLIFGGGAGAASFSDIYRYNISGDEVTVTALTHAGGASISGRYSMGMVGNATSGIICLGEWNNGRGQRSFPSDFYLYTVTGNNITTTALTKAGTGRNLVGRKNFGIVGNSLGGLIFAGYKGSVGDLDEYYHYSVQGTTITLTTLAKRGESRTPFTSFGFASMAGNITNSIVFGGRIDTRPHPSNFYRAVVSTSANTVTFTPLTKRGDRINLITSKELLQNPVDEDSRFGLWT